MIYHIILHYNIWKMLYRNMNEMCQEILSRYHEYYIEEKVK